MTWKDVVGYEGLYKVSEYGEIYGLKSKKILKQQETHRGYLCVNLYKNSKMKSIVVHRLVAIAFLPNPKDKPEVNHIDGNKQNNNLDNLEWSTRSENMIHAYKNDLQPKSEKQSEHARNLMLKINKEKQMPVGKYDSNMNLIEEYNSVTEASKSINGNKMYVSDISKCCRGKSKTCKGFIWKFI